MWKVLWKKNIYLLLWLGSDIENVFSFRVSSYLLIILLSNSSNQEDISLKRMSTRRYFIHIRWEGNFFPRHQDACVSRLNIPRRGCTARGKGQGDGTFMCGCGWVDWGDAHPAVERHHHGIWVHLPQHAEAGLIIRWMIREESENERGNCNGGYFRVEGD